MTVYKGWNAKIYINIAGAGLQEIGKASSVTIQIDRSLEAYFEAGSRTAVSLKEGPIRVSGRLSKAWVDINYLSLLCSTSELSSFNLEIRVGSTPFTLYIYDCKFKKGSIGVPQDGWLKEDYDFLGLSIGSE